MPAANDNLPVTKNHRLCRKLVNASLVPFSDPSSPSLPPSFYELGRAYAVDTQTTINEPLLRSLLLSSINRLNQNGVVVSR
jgi:hypothetical protein